MALHDVDSRWGGRDSRAVVNLTKRMKERRTGMMPVIGVACNVVKPLNSQGLLVRLKESGSGADPNTNQGGKALKS